MLQLCKKCGSSGDYTNWLVLVLAGEQGPDWMCLRCVGVQMEVTSS